MDGITLSGPGINVENDQTPFDLFTNQSSGASENTLLFEIAGFAPETFFSEDRLNTNNAAQGLIFQGDDQTVLQASGRQPGVFSDNEFIIAFEDKLVGGL